MRSLSVFWPYFIFSCDRRSSGCASIAGLHLKHNSKQIVGGRCQKSNLGIWMQSVQIRRLWRHCLVYILMETYKKNSLLVSISKSANIKNFILPWHKKIVICSMSHIGPRRSILIFAYLGNRCLGELGIQVRALSPRPQDLAA
jgi:hypothetical protein